MSHHPAVLNMASAVVPSCRVVMSMSDQLSRRCTIERNYSGMSTRIAGVSVTREHALKTCKSSCVSGAARPFFIPVVHSPLGTVGYVAAPKLSSRGGRAQSHGTRDSTGAHLVREARFRAECHVTATELTSTRRRGLGPRDTWWRRSPPLHGGVVRRYSVRGSVWLHDLLLILT
jgi:hypothetical protein